MDGRLDLFDLRFPLESTPVTSFLGHVNSHSPKLVSQGSEPGCRLNVFTKCRTQAFTVDPSERFIFAAGQDKVIRAWSVSNGQLLCNPEMETITGTGQAVGLLNTMFEDEVSEMQLVKDDRGLHLWYSTGSVLCNQTIL